MAKRGRLACMRITEKVHVTNPQVGMLSLPHLVRGRCREAVARGIHVSINSHLAILSTLSRRVHPIEGLIQVIWSEASTRIAAAQGRAEVYPVQGPSGEEGCAQLRHDAWADCSTASVAARCSCC